MKVGIRKSSAKECKNLRICCKHNRSHGAAGREAGYEYFAAVGIKCRNGVLDHLIERASPWPRAMSPGKNHEKQFFGLVGGLLLRIDDREAEAVSEGRPAGAVIILV
jgi:hypothetical protein